MYQLLQNKQFNFIFFIFLLFVGFTTTVNAECEVQGYYKKNGTWVDGYTRSGDCWHGKIKNYDSQGRSAEDREEIRKKENRIILPFALIIFFIFYLLDSKISDNNKYKEILNTIFGLLGLYIIFIIFTDSILLIIVIILGLVGWIINEKTSFFESKNIKYVESKNIKCVKSKNIKCVKCKKKNNKNNKFCIYCGINLNIQKNSSPSQKYIEYNEILNSYDGIVVAFLAKVAKADGTISKDEAIFISAVYDNLCNQRVNILNVREIYRQILNNEKNRFDNIYELSTQFISLDNDKKHLIELLVKLAYTDGEYHEKEEELIVKIVHYLKFDFSIYKNIVNKYRGIQ